MKCKIVQPTNKDIKMLDSGHIRLHLAMESISVLFMARKPTHKPQDVFVELEGTARQNLKSPCLGVPCPSVCPGYGYACGYGDLNQGEPESETCC
jgi:hypothetical protein